MNKTARTVLYILSGFMLSVVSVIGFGALWGLTTWGDIGIDEIIFQLQAPLEGTGNGMLLQYALKGLLPAVLMVAMFVICLWRARTAGRRTAFALAVTIASLLAGMAVRGYIWERLNVAEWLAGRADASTFVQDNYVDPAGVRLTFPERKRNLIYIYLESMEMTYADEASGGARPENVIPELTALAQENEDFSGSSGKLNGGQVFSGTGSTTSAMFGHMTGLPLKLAIGGNNMDTQDSFFPGIIGLGDILEKEGYRQVLLIGSNATFGGRRLLFQDHGNFEIMDHNYAKKQGWIPQDYKVFWGYEDEKLFAFAKELLQELAAGEQPFNLTLLTVDTHFEDGYVCRLCGNEFGDDQYANVIACSSRQTAAFVRWVQEQDFYQDTAIVLSGDHTTMDKNFLQDIDRDFQRKTYTAFVNAAAVPADPGKERVYCTLDMFPTTLAAMGASIDGDRLGLGTNLFSGTATLSEEYGALYERRELAKRSVFLEHLEKTDEHAQALLARYRSDLKNSLAVEACDFEKGEIRIRVKNVFSSGLKASVMEAAYQEAGAERIDTVVLEQEPGDENYMIGTLDVSAWSVHAGEIRINVTMAESGETYEDVVSAQVEGD